MAEKGLSPASKLIDNAPAAIAGLSVSGVVSDSRQVRGNELFFGLNGVAANGDRYLDAALAAGAVGAVVETAREGLEWHREKPVWRTPAAREILGEALARWHALDAETLFIAGVTGTNGKSSVTHLLSAVLPQPGHVVGTLGRGLPEQLVPQANTTPDTEALHAALAACRAAGARSVALEVSSHGLSLNRIAGVPIQLALFTNLSRDHLDFHGDMETYFAAKAKLFTRPGLRYAVINADDPWAARLLEKVPPAVRTITYGLRQGQIRPSRLELSADGIRMQLPGSDGDVTLRSAWLGQVNAYNLLAAFAAGLAVGESPTRLVEQLARVAPVPGRLQRLPGPSAAPSVVVDYAHTPDALESVLRGLREITPGKLWCVFGCGGDRDQGKRPQMGRIAESGADWVLCTDDNPRSEDPERIVDQILAGMAQPRAALRIHDRERAIRLAILAARPGDCVLIAGKGHETYQEVAGVRHPFDDAAVARQALEAWTC